MYFEVSLDYTVRICLKRKLMGVGDRRTKTYWEDIPFVMCGDAEEQE